MKRKVISLLLLVVMLASQFSVVFAEEQQFPTTGGTMYLLDYLIDNGLDEDEDGTLSDVEWAKVKNLDFSDVEGDIDISGIENAINLRTLSLTLHETPNFSNIDFSKLQKLEKLDVNYTFNISNISNATSLKELYVHECDISNIDFSKLTKLEYLSINTYSGQEIDLSVISDAINLRDVSLWGDLANVSSSDIDFSKLQNLESVYIQNNNGETSIDLSGISEATNLSWIHLVNNCDITNVDFSKLTKLEFLSTDTTPNLNGASSLKRLTLSDDCDISVMDFSKLQNLEDLHIESLNKNYTSIDFPVMNNLKELFINGFEGSFEEINLSKLNNLVNFRISSGNTRKIYFPKFNCIENIDIESTFYEDNVGKVTDFELDLENCKNAYGYVYISDIEKMKLNESCIAYRCASEYDGISKVRIDEVSKEITLYKEGMAYEDGFIGVDVKCEENDIVSLTNIDGGYSLVGKNIGTQNITIIDALGRNVEVLVSVKEIPNDNINTDLEDSGITAEFVETHTILKSNGELWKINSETTAEKIDTNVKDYTWCESYTNAGGIMQIKNKLKQDNKLVIDIIGWDWNYDNDDMEFTYTTTIDGVKGIGPNVYLTTSGELFEIYYNYIIEQVQTSKVKENVKKIIGDCIVLEDGTTWCQDKFTNTMEGVYGRIEQFFKVTDFEIKENGWYTHEGNEYWCIVDMNNNLYGFEDYYGWIMMWDGENYSTQMTLLKENFVDYYASNNVWMFLGRQLFDDSVSDFFTANGQKLVLSNIARNDTYWGDMEVNVLIRTDGTIWTYSDRYGLTKITKSTVVEEEDEPKEFLNSTAKINSKELGNSTVISGISNNTNVQNFLKQNNFNNAYQAKVFDKNNNEMTGESLLGTGSTVRLYEDGKVVKEYVVVIYGDTTGDGKITAVDALALIKHINNKILFTDEVFLEAGRVRPNSGTTLTSVDALAIIKGVNGKFTINQYK